jgi:hypothetical protein
VDIPTALAAILRHTVGMAWKIAWGLALGFMISGAIQAFVSREEIARHLGRPTLRALALASFFGFASSSCSYAAAAMSKTLFQKGSHIVNATAFLFASTNLVIEIGLIIWVLLGWQFVLAEFVGGILLIVVMAVLLRWFAPAGVFEEARRHLDEAGGGGHEHHGHGETLPASALLSRRGLAATGRYLSTDVRMVGRDIVLGLVIAGTLAALVPQEWWRSLFLTAGSGGAVHPGFWVSVENAVVGPVIAIVSFVCSVGNIPMASVLWAGGISFGGVVAFIFADLVTIPMVLVYRRYYGWKPALVYAGYLLATMVVTALIVDGLFRLTGMAPEVPVAARRGLQHVDYFAWDYTAWLNLVFVPLAAGLWWLGSRRAEVGEHRHGG